MYPQITQILYLLSVPIDRFITQRKNAWQRLEDLLKLLDTATLKRLPREEVRELGRIYRRTASDLAIARAESRDPRMVASIALSRTAGNASSNSSRVNCRRLFVAPGATRFSRSRSSWFSRSLAL
jgi:hypothetical protein